MMGRPAQAATVAQPSGAVELTKATFPPVALMAMLPVASGAGRSAVPPAPADSRTRKYWPGCSVMGGNSVSRPPLPMFPVVLPYCTDMPARDAGKLPRLKISMKSFLKVAPAFPPPPYTWLMTRSGEPWARAGEPIKSKAADAASAGTEILQVMGCASCAKGCAPIKRRGGAISEERSKLPGFRGFHDAWFDLHLDSGAAGGDKAAQLAHLDFEGTADRRRCARG